MQQNSRADLYKSREKAESTALTLLLVSDTNLESTYLQISFLSGREIDASMISTLDKKVGI